MSDTGPSGTVTPITVEEFQRRIERGDPLAVLDVREEVERAYCAIALPATAVDLHVPMTRLLDQIESIREAARDRPLVVYCHHGVRSLGVARELVRCGLAGSVFNLEGGIDAWSARIDRGVRRY